MEEFDEEEFESDYAVYPNAYPYGFDPDASYEDEYEMEEEPEDMIWPPTEEDEPEE